MWPFNRRKESSLSPEGQSQQEQLATIFYEEADRNDDAIRALFKRYKFSWIGSTALDLYYQTMPYHQRIFEIDGLETGDLGVIEKSLKRRRNAMKGRAHVWKKRFQVRDLRPLLKKSVGELDALAESLTAPFPELREPK